MARSALWRSTASPPRLARGRAWVALALLPAVAAGAEARLELSGALPCGLADRLVPALADRQITVVPGAAWVFAVRADAQGLALTLTNPDGAVRGSRRLTPGPADCAALADSVALLAKLWFGQELTIAPKPPAPVPPPLPPTRPKPPLVPIVVSEPVLSPPPAPPAAEPEPAVASAPPIAIEAPPVLTEFEVALPAPSGRTPSPLAGFSVLGLGGGAFDGRDGVGAGGGAIEWEFLDAWALSIEGGAQSDRLGTAAPGSVAVSLRWATLGVRRFFFERLALAVGIQAIHFHASPRGYSNARVGDVVAPAATAQVEWRQPLTGALFGLIRVEGSARVNDQAFTVDPIGRVITVPWWTAGVSGGLGWRF